LEQLVDIITRPNQLDQSSLGSLVRNLYPGSRVTDSIVVKVVGSLGHGRMKPSYSTQAALLKWLIMVYDILENQRLLSKLYSVLFNLIDTSALRYFTTTFSRPLLSLLHPLTHIRAQLCHLLSLITRRKHVRPFRIQVL
jgi:centromere protein I